MGHIAVAYLCLVIADQYREVNQPDGMAVLIVTFGALFPDLVDKPLAWYFGMLPSGRSLAHSFVVLVPLCVIVIAIARRKGRTWWGLAFGIGVISHALLDALPALWREDSSVSFLLYPILGVEEYGEEGPPTVWGLLLNSLHDPYFLIEFPLLAVAAIVWYREGKPGLSIIHRWIATVRRIGRSL